MAVDPRFYNQLGLLTAHSIAQTLGFEPGDGPDKEITGLASFETARADELCFIEDLRHFEMHDGAHRPGVCLVRARPDVADMPDTVFMVTEQPKERFFEIATTLFGPRNFASDGGAAKNIHATASIGPGVQIGDGVAIGKGTRIGANSVIGPGVQIGSNCRIGTNVSVHFSLIGNDVHVLAGARLGETGFGLVPSKRSGLDDIPHFGRVILQDDVTIGANTCVDRGMLDDTIIGEGTKIDNQGHIGHNTVIGRNTVMAAYAGISGSVVVGDNVRMGGRVGLVDHIRVGDGAQIAAGSAVMSSVPDNEAWAGAPAKPIRTWQRELVWLKKQARKDKSR